MNIIKFDRKGFSLFELYLFIFIGSILMASIALIYHGGLKSWDGGYTRYKMKRNLAFALERMGKDLRVAKRVEEYSNKKHTIEFDISEQGVLNTYVYYLYSPDDSWPNQKWKADYYQLRKTQADSQGHIEYGEGLLLLENLKSPKVSDTSIEVKSGEVILEFSASSGDEAIHMRTVVKTRNVL